MGASRGSPAGKEADKGALEGVSESSPQVEARDELEVAEADTGNGAFRGWFGGEGSRTAATASEFCRFRKLVFGRGSRGPVGIDTLEMLDADAERGMEEPSGPPGFGRGGIGIEDDIDMMGVRRVPVGPVIIGVGVFDRASVVEGASRWGGGG